MSDVRIGDIGTIFEVTITNDGDIVDVSSASVKRLKIKKKNKTTYQRDMEFVTSGSDGKLQYTSGSGDLDIEGAWQGQIYLEMPGGKWHSDIFEFDVGEIIEVTGGS